MNIQHHPTHSRYIACIGRDARLLQAGLALRARQYRASATPEDDHDSFDAACHHIVIRADNAPAALAYARLCHHADAHSILAGYSAERYDLGRFAPTIGAAAELGRLCLAPQVRDVNVLRSLWGAITACISSWRVGHVFGCHSFDGLNAMAQGPVFGKLTEGHLAPEGWNIQPLGPDRFSMRQAAQTPAQGHRGNFPSALTRAYLSLGAVFAEQGTIDHDLQRLHTFACLNTRAVRPERRRAMLGLAREIMRDASNRIDAGVLPQ